MKTKPLSSQARIYISGLGLLALAAALALLTQRLPSASLLDFLLVTSLGVIAHAFPIKAPRHQSYQATLPFIIVAAATFSAPQLVAFILLIHLGEQLRVRRRWYIQSFNVFGYFLAAAIACVLYHRAAALLPGTVLGPMEAALTAGSAFVLFNRVFLAGILWLARGVSLARSGLFRPELLAVDLIITWIAAPMLVLDLLGGSWTLVVAAGPLFLFRPAFASILAATEKAVRPRRARAA